MKPSPFPPPAPAEHVATVDDGRAPVSDNQQAVDYHRQQRNLARMELVFQLFNIGDAVTTISCVERRTCKETNPLYGGKHPSWGRVAGIKAGVGLIHYLAYRTLSKSNPRLAKIFEISTIAIQGSVVLWNIAVTLK